MFADVFLPTMLDNTKAVADFVYFMPNISFNFGNVVI